MALRCLALGTLATYLHQTIRSTFSIQVFPALISLLAPHRVKIPKEQKGKQETCLGQTGDPEDNPKGKYIL